jgi:hypothetical protein
MIINDRIYGQVEITEPIILELLDSPALVRLKSIDQGGYTKPFFPDDKITRFEHSVGVYWLLKKYGASLPEQVAGLIHDISHSAFSHCIDYILESGDGGQQNHQDNVFADYVRHSELPALLKKYDLNINYILEEENFPLKERPLPELCADRIDYFLRTALIIKEANPEEIQYFLDNLAVKNNQWVFKNIEAAEKYANLFLHLNQTYWASVGSAAMHLSVGDCLGYALKKNYISHADLYSTDEQILKKIITRLDSDPQLDFFWKRMNNKSGYEDNPADYYKKVQLKSRVVDPWFINKASVAKLSDIKPEWLDIISAGLKPKSRFIKFLD